METPTVNWNDPIDPIEELKKYKEICNKIRNDNKYYIDTPRNFGHGMVMSDKVYFKYVRCLMKYGDKFDRDKFIEYINSLDN